MCHVLYQVMACNHSRAICLNACPVARGSSYPDPFQDPQRGHTPASARPVSIAIPKDEAIPPAQIRTGFLRPPHPYTQLDSYEPTVDYCFTFRPIRAAAQSKYACLKCCIRPEFSKYCNRWIQDYRSNHPMGNPELLLELSGLAQIPERVGMVDDEEGAEKRKERSRSVKDGVQFIEFERVLPEGFERWSMEERKRALRANPEVKLLRWDEVDVLE